MTADTGQVLPEEADALDLGRFALFRVHPRLAMIDPTMRTTSPRFDPHARAPAHGLAGGGWMG